MSTTKSSKQETTYLNQNQLEELAKDPTNRIYEYTYDDPTHQFTPQERQELMKEVHENYLALRQEHPEEKDDEIRERLYTSNETWKKFADNHAKVFSTMTDREVPADHINHLRYMVYLRIEEAAGNIAPHMVQMMLQDYLVEKFKTGESLDSYKERLAEEEKAEPVKPHKHHCSKHKE